MSKKTPVKKSRRRLKRSIRRSLAAVLMITAIAVAAIPVPENYAAPEGGETESGTEKKEDVHAAAVAELHKYQETGTYALLDENGEKQYQKDENGKDKVDADGNKILITDTYTGADEPAGSYTNFNLNKYAGKTSAELESMNIIDWDGADLDENGNETDNGKKDNPPIYVSYATQELGGGNIALSWQFMFYYQVVPDVFSVGSVICKYNNQFFQEQVVLPLQPVTSYYVIEEDDFKYFFDNTDAAKHKAAVKKMKNLDPTLQVSYTYNDYEGMVTSADGTESLDEQAKADVTFLQDYCEDEYDKKTDEFAAYYTSDKTGKMPDPLTRTPAEVLDKLGDEAKKKYYCEHDPNIPGSGFSLEEVTDNRPNKNGGSIYLARSETANPEYDLDDNRFLVTNRSNRMICAIGGQAFKGVGKVANMEIPEMLGYIGDEAFADATLLREVHLKNVKSVGNRAFKGCEQLAVVDFQDGVTTIGAEAFSGTAIQSIKLPRTVTRIGHGAFARCTRLTEVDLNSIDVNKAAEKTIGDYAFYDCYSLEKVLMADSGITAIGQGAFSVASGSKNMDFVFPTQMSGVHSIGDFMFAGRSNLQSVVFPQLLGNNTAPKETEIPANIFHGCTNLGYVQFPAGDSGQYCGFVKYNPEKLFADVVNPNLYVQGPKTNANGEVARPRENTWTAVTAVVNGIDEDGNLEKNPVPYLYVENGKEYYEVSNGTYLLCIEKNADGNGILTRCTLKPNGKVESTTLRIPSKVGNTKVTSIASGCFAEDPLSLETTRKFYQAIERLIIEDDSISEIGADVFKGWGNLKSVTIGNSVKKIDNGAFENCKVLEDVTFHTPLSGNYSEFEIVGTAFKTGSDKLTFHGDVVSEYAPFKWAMDPNNVIKDTENEGKVRVCYRGLSPSYMTVMYNPVTDMVTMLDYPKADQISGILKEAHADEIADSKASSYEEWMTNKLYAKYAEYTDFNDNARKEFAILWKTSEDRSKLYQSEFYGPWINPGYCAEWSEWTNGNPHTKDDEQEEEDQNEGAKSIIDWFFEPITAYAAEQDTPAPPDPYYTTYKYDPVLNVDSNDPYRAPTAEEQEVVYATRNIVVPEGIDSIDVYGYVNNLTKDGKATEGSERNTANYLAYFYNGSWNSETKKMYVGPSSDESDSTEIVPGLFSGYYKDYENASDSETYVRGNDLIESVTLNSVKYLPDYAFDSCERLKTVTLGKDCADIGTAPFRGCYELTAVNGNDYYEVDNGIIYSKNDDASLTVEECLSARGRIGYVGQPAVTIANDPKLGSVSAIKPGAFEDCDYISRILFGSNDIPNLKVIPNDCFRNCDALLDVELPKSVNDIGKGAFVGSKILTNLTIYGKEVKISGDAFENSEENPRQGTTVITYEDSAVVRYVAEYGEDYLLWIDEAHWLGEQWKVTFVDENYQIIKELKDMDGEPLDNPQYVADGEKVIQPADYVGAEGWTFDQWLGMNGKKINDRIYENTTFYASGFSDSGMVGGKYPVSFWDQMTANQIGQTQYVLPGQSAIAPQPPTHTDLGYTFSKWSSDEYTNVQKELTIMAMYDPIGTVNPGGSPGGTPGTTPGTSTGTTTNTSNKSTSSSTSSTSTSSSSTSSTSTTSGSSSEKAFYTVTVENGHGSGSYAVGSTVVIAANTPAAGMQFSKWTTESNGVNLASVSLSATTFIMPENNVTVTANYVTASTPTATPVSGTGTTTPASDDGNTRVDITKPGISNKDLATADVNGSTDNFIVKISETDEATQAVSAALLNKYGNLDNILYYAMDISLYDSTGTTKITDTSGLSIDITIPIPDALITYGGNNMAGAVVNGSQLEDLSEKFTTVNGVPMVTFTATHFSPYTIYVDTGNLVAGELDVTPKTGDPIHPKWFLSIGLACLSVILFIKKDKARVKVKA